MKFFDRYKISLHNIKNNKSRSILTTTIVYVISLLIMTILCIGISFSNNMISVTNEYYQKSDEPITVSFYMYEKSLDGRVLDKDIYNQIKPKVSEHESIISYITYSSSYDSRITITDARFSLNDFYELIEGENITSTDSNTNSVLVSAEYANNHYLKTGNKLNPGDTIDYQFNYSVFKEEDNQNYYTQKTKDLSLKVKGIYKTKETDQPEYGMTPFSNNTQVIIDIEYLFNTIDTFTIQNATYYYNVSQTNFNNTELKNKLQVFVDDLNAIVPQNERGNSVSSSALEDLKMTGIIGIAIIGIAAFLCLVLILLSIGSLANTIMISVDKNKKFIGLLKALGLNEKDLKSTIKLESVTTIVLGIALSFLTIYLFKGVLTDLNTLIINSVFSNYVNAIDYKAVLYLPLYIPIVVLLFFVAFTLLFAKGSMSKIAKTDPMAVISEVA